MNNPKHYREIEKEVLVGHLEKKEERNGQLIIIKVPVYQKTKVIVSNFPRTYHNLQAESISLTNAAAARNGHRIKMAITNRLEKIESLQDKTKQKDKWGFGKKDY